MDLNKMVVNPLTGCSEGNHRPYSTIDMTLVGQNISDYTLAEIDFALDDLLMPYKID